MRGREWEIPATNHNSSNQQNLFSGMGMEVCCTLGMLNETQAKQLKEAGLTAYNHNLDTSREFYPKVKSKKTKAQRKNWHPPHSFI